MTFKVESYGSYSVLSSDALSFVRHGFIGRTGNFSEKERSKAEKEFKNTFGVEHLFLPTQVHGKAVLDLRRENKLTEGDAVIIGRDASGIAIGVRTADCLPIFLATEDAYAVIHAGWRGLAVGVIEETVRALNITGKVKCVIGPAAGYECYEVGREVIDSIGPPSVYKEYIGGKYLLSLAGTAVSILDGSLPRDSTIVVASVCTILSSDYHSFRRDKENRGSNLSFIIP